MSVNDDKNKITLMNAVKHETFYHMEARLEKYELQHEDESFFDYELLKAALHRKHQAIVNYLLKKGCRVVNPNETSSEETPLHLAMKMGNFPIIKKILNSGATIYDKNHNGDTALYAAFKEKHFNAIDAVLQYSTKNMKRPNSNLKSFNKKDKDNIIHFHIACVRNNLHALKQYLSCGFDVNTQFTLESTDLNGLNPVHYAIMNNNCDMLDLFLKHDANLSIKNNEGQTPLQMIYYFGLSGFGEYRISEIFKNGNDTKFINSVDDNGVSHFHLCCTIDSYDCVQVFINKGVNINSTIFSTCPIFSGFTPLHFAVMHGHENIVKLLLENGADLNKTDTKGVTPLHLACELTKESAYPIIQMLLNYKACTSALNHKSQTFLHSAFYHLSCEETKIFDLLMSKIPKTNFIDDQNLSLFHIACTRSDVNLVNDFLKSGVAVDNCVESGEYKGYTALYFAVLYNQKDVVEMLLKWKAQINVKAGLRKVTPLHLACNYNYNDIYYKNASDDKLSNIDFLSKMERKLEIINLLLAHGADVDAKDFLGKTPLFYVCSLGPSVLELSKEIANKMIEIIELLLSYKANINAQLHNTENSILHFIIENEFLKQSEELLDFLISKGADVETVDYAGSTPLHVAVTLKKKEIVDVLLKHKANINAKSKNSMIPLQMLLEDFSESSEEDNDLLSVLLENGSDVNVSYRSDRTIRTPWLNAIRERDTFMLEKLLKYGVDINIKDEFGRSLLVSAIKKNRKYENITYFSSANIVHILQNHIVKLQLAGIYISGEIRTGVTEICIYYEHVCITESLSHRIFILHCKEELDKMKVTKIDKFTLLYNILHKDEHDLAKYVRNNSLSEILDKQNLNKNFPIYSDLLSLQFKKGLMRINILESANTSLSLLIGLNVPDLCSSLVFKYLTNEDITNLKLATRVKKAIKRERDSDSFITEPLVKMRKMD